MEGRWSITFENMGVSSYLTVTFPEDGGLIGYQLEMISSNTIEHLLAVSKRMVNGEMVAYYNISSKIQLSRILERRKLKKEEMICILQGALQAVKEGREYQLSESGLVMEPEYIYVAPDTCSPSFLYLPVEHTGAGGIRELLEELIMHGHIEMSNDNFIQVLLEVLNQQPFSLDQLASCLETYRKPLAGRQMETSYGGISAGAVPQGNGMGDRGHSFGSPFSGNAAAVPGERPAFTAGDNFDSQGGARPATGWEMPEKQEEMRAVPGGRPARPAGKPAVPEQVPEKKIFSGKGKTKKEKKQKPRKQDAAGAKTADGEFDKEAAKKKFLLPQALVLVVLAALVSFGAFTDESGSIVLNNVLAAVLIVVVAEVILYREVYVNGKETGKQKKSKNGRASETRGKSLKPPIGSGKKEGKTGRPAVPGTVRGAKDGEQPVSPIQPLNFQAPNRGEQKLPADRPQVGSAGGVQPFTGNGSQPFSGSGMQSFSERGSQAVGENGAPVFSGTGTPFFAENQGPFFSGDGSRSFGAKAPQVSFDNSSRPFAAASAFGPYSGAQGAGPSAMDTARQSAAATTLATELGGETELWEGDQDGGAYLEYYVNGVMSRVPLNRPSTLIGRLSSQVDFAVSNPKVGKIHAEFLNQNGQIYVKDQNSKNGTYINRSGQRINSNIPYPLKDNDQISLADSEFILRCGSR